MNQEEIMDEVGSSESAFLDAAEEIFSERGYDGASMRSIAEKAKGNVGAIHYYFGTKEALIKKTLERRIRPTREKCIQALEACFPSSQDEIPDIKKVLNAFIKPIVIFSEETNPIFDKLMLRMLSDPSPKIQGLVHSLLNDTTFLFIRLLRKCNPELSNEEFHWRLISILGSTQFMFTNRPELERISHGQFKPKDTNKGVAQLVYNLTCMFMAPPIKTKD